MAKGVASTVCSQPEWFARIQVGSVIAEKNGTYRIVRQVTRRSNGALLSVTLTIQRCSWTGRCYTVIMANDLKARKFRLIPVRPVRLKGDLNERISKAITQAAYEPYAARCCDVRGIA